MAELEPDVDVDFLAVAEEQLEQDRSERYEEEPVQETGLESFMAATETETVPVDELLDPVLQAISDTEKYGDPRELTPERSSGGFFFDGDAVRDAEGQPWQDLNPEMFAQWREGGGSAYLLPDHKEKTEDGEILFITVMQYNSETKEVSYQIFSREITNPKEEETSLPRIDNEREVEDYIAMWQEYFEDEQTNETVEETQEMMLAAEQVVEEEDAETENEDAATVETLAQQEAAPSAPEVNGRSVEAIAAEITETPQAEAAHETASDHSFQSMFEELLNDGPLEILDDAQTLTAEPELVVASGAETIETDIVPTIIETPAVLANTTNDTDGTGNEAIVAELVEQPVIALAEEQQETEAHTDSAFEQPVIALVQEPQAIEAHTDTAAEQHVEAMAPVVEKTAEEVTPITLLEIEEADEVVEVIAQQEIQHIEPLEDDMVETVPDMLSAHAEVFAEREESIPVSKEIIPAAIEAIIERDMQVSPMQQETLQTLATTIEAQNIIAPRVEIAHENNMTRESASPALAAQKTSTPERLTPERAADILRALGMPTSSSREKSAEPQQHNVELLRPLPGKPRAYAPASRSRSTSRTNALHGVRMEQLAA